MGWEKYLIGWLAALALGIVVAFPAVASTIDCFTDDRGVIHITNNIRKDKAPETNPEPADSPGPRDKNDKLRQFYELRGQQFVPSLGPGTSPPEAGDRS